MKRAIIMALSIGLTLSMLSGCGSTKEPASLHKEDITSVAEGDVENAQGESAGAEQGAESAVDANNSAAETGLLQELIEGTAGLSFDFYKGKYLNGSEYPSYVDETIQRIPDGREYTLSELKDTLNEIFHTEEYYYAEADVESISYSFLDCGNDGVKEIALLLKGPFVEPESEVTMVIKEIDGKLQVVHAFASWSRSYTEINEYGLIYGGGSNGASNHGGDEGYINADGVYTYGYYEEEEADIDMFAEFRDHDEFDASSLPGAICVYTLRIGEYSESGNEEYYSYKVFNSENYEEMDVPNLYTDSEYQKIMDCFKDIQFIPYDELEKKEEERMASLGVDETIRSGARLEYTEIN